jgi:hypothetical protein
MDHLTPEGYAAVRAGIEALVVEFAWLVDHGRAAELPDLFTPDGVFLATGIELRGREALEARFSTRGARQDRTSRHVCTNLRIEMDGADRARGTVVLINYRHDGEGMGPPVPLLVGEWDDEYARGADGRWRFASRRLSRVFASEGRA